MAKRRHCPQNGFEQGKISTDSTACFLASQSALPDVKKNLKTQCRALPLSKKYERYTHGSLR